MSAASAEQAERAFAKALLSTIDSQPVQYPNDYQQPPSNSLKKVPILQIPLPPPPEPKEAEASTSSSAPITLTIKSLKPPASYTLSVLPTDSISALKSQLSATYPHSAPPPDAQRLLIKGKALADAKLLKEYTVKDGDVVNLLVKPGVVWDPNSSSTNANANTIQKDTDVTMAAPTPTRFGSGTLTPSLSSTTTPSRPGKHTRIPSVVLSPSPSNDVSPSGAGGVGGPADAEKDIVLTVDPLPSPILGANDALSGYHRTLVKPEFWERFLAFLRQEFTADVDVHTAFEDFLSAAKGSLTANEIAKIRDHVGIIGMAGT